MKSRVMEGFRSPMTFESKRSGACFPGRVGDAVGAIFPSMVCLRDVEHMYSNSFVREADDFGTLPEIQEHLTRRASHTGAIGRSTMCENATSCGTNHYLPQRKSDSDSGLPES